MKCAPSFNKKEVNMAEKMWMIRAGRNAMLVQDFEDGEYVSVGWQGMGDWTKIASKDQMEKALKKAYPDHTLPKRRMSLGQISRFRFEIQKGDLVTTYNPELRTYPVVPLRAKKKALRGI